MRGYDEKKLSFQLRIGIGLVLHLAKKNIQYSKRTIKVESDMVKIERTQMTTYEFFLRDILKRAKVELVHYWTGQMIRTTVENHFRETNRNDQERIFFGV